MAPILAEVIRMIFCGIWFGTWLHGTRGTILAALSILRSPFEPPRPICLRAAEVFTTGLRGSIMDLACPRTFTTSRHLKPHSLLSECLPNSDNVKEFHLYRTQLNSSRLLSKETASTLRSLYQVFFLF